MSELNDANATTNSYLELRKAKIERNKQVLESLGLGSSSSPKNNRKVKPLKNNGVEVHAEVVMRTRRSSRLRSSRTPDFDLEKNTPEIQMDSVTSANDSGLNEVDKTEKQNKVRKRPRGEITHKKKAIDRSEAKPGTTRATNIDIKQTLYGHFDYPLFVGRRLKNTGKAAVVEHAAFMCGIEPGLGFNKYSGVCEFRNDAIFLWVNIGVPDADVKNEFLDSENEGNQITWFGGSKMKEESPIIQKLITVGQKASSGDLPDSCGIVLWCRLHSNDSKGKFEPYTCLGRLGYHSHEIGSSPVKFVWNLLDYKVLMHASQGNDGKSLFEAIVEKTNL